MTDKPDEKPDEKSKNLKRNKPVSRASFGRGTVDRRQQIGSQLGQQVIVPQIVPQRPPVRKEEPKKKGPSLFEEEPPAKTGTEGKEEKPAPQVVIPSSKEWEREKVQGWLEEMATTLQQEQRTPPAVACCGGNAVVAAALLAGPGHLEHGLKQMISNRRLLLTDRQWLPDLRLKVSNFEEILTKELQKLALSLLNNYGSLESSPPGGDRAQLKTMAELFSCEVKEEERPQDVLTPPEIRFWVLEGATEEREAHWVVQGTVSDGFYLYDPWSAKGAALHFYTPGKEDKEIAQLFSQLS
jgi:hypothetical protein